MHIPGWLFLLSFIITSNPKNDDDHSLGGTVFTISAKIQTKASKRSRRQAGVGGRLQHLQLFRPRVGHHRRWRSKERLEAQVWLVMICSELMNLVNQIEGANIGQVLAEHYYRRRRQRKVKTCSPSRFKQHCEQCSR